ncbi:integrase [Deinococcus radiopugnans ATCC 19172]|uniref:Integrase n=1 Tax=Deinococcus radiopugnans ATCC 19172 TaxID=585398 RepID=A0ABR6NM55_9DEIO|nr:integrase [Deinococcus radiopugnans ATCC 19172]
MSKQLGHASPAFTLTQYRTVFTSEREKWALNLSELLGAD